MAEYFEREALIDDLNAAMDHRGMGQVIGQTLIRYVKRQPAADVAPVLHGRWILEREPNGKPYCFHCSVCDSDYHCIGIVVASDYCPNCGAKMDGGADHE